MRKNCFITLAAASVFIVSGCQSISPLNNSIPINTNYGSLKLTMKIADSGMHTQAVDVFFIRKVQIFIKGLGIDSLNPVYPTGATSSASVPYDNVNHVINLGITDKTFTASFNNNIPVGKNRIIVVNGLDLSNNVVSKVKSLVNIDANASTILKNEISWRTTPAGETVDYLIQQNKHLLAAGVDPVTLQDNIDLLTGFNSNTSSFTKRHPSLVKSDALGNGIINKNSTLDKEATPVLEPVPSANEPNVSIIPRILDGNVEPNVTLLVRAENKIIKITEFSVQLLDPGSKTPLSASYIYADLTSFNTIELVNPVTQINEIFYKIPYKLENITPNLNRYFLKWRCKHIKPGDATIYDDDEGFLGSAPRSVDINNTADFTIIIGQGI